MRTLLTFLLFSIYAVVHGQAIWGVLSEAQQNGSGPPSVLVKVLPGPGPLAIQVDTLRRLPGQVPVEVDGLALSDDHGLVGFMLYPDSSVLCQVDTLDGSCATLAPPFIGLAIQGAAFDGLGQLWAIDGGSSSLLRIGFPSAVIQASVPLTLNGSSFDLSQRRSDIAFNGSDLYLQSDQDLFLVDPVTGDLTPQFTHTLLDANDTYGNCQNNSFPPRFGGIAFHWSTDTVLYCLDTNCEDDVYTYSLDQQPAVEVISDPVPQFNSGSNDLASATPPFSVGLPLLMPGSTIFSAAYLEHMLILNGIDLPVEADLTIRDGVGRMIHAKSAVDLRQPITGLSLDRGLHLIELHHGAQRRCAKLLVW